MSPSQNAQKSLMRELGTSGSNLERASSSDNSCTALRLSACVVDGKKPSKVLARSSKIVGEKNATRRFKSAAAVDERLPYMPASVLDRVIPVFKRFGKPMETRTQSAFLGCFE